jgi:hypothetical protein
MILAINQNDIDLPCLRGIRYLQIWLLWQALSHERTNKEAALQTLWTQERYRSEDNNSIDSKRGANTGINEQRPVKNICCDCYIVDVVP